MAQSAGVGLLPPLLEMISAVVGQLLKEKKIRATSVDADGRRISMIICHPVRGKGEQGDLALGQSYLASALSEPSCILSLDL